MSVFKILTRIPTGRPRHSCKDSIRMDLKEISVDMRNWIYSAQDRDCWKVLMNAAFGPPGFIKSHGVSYLYLPLALKKYF